MALLALLFKSLADESHNLAVLFVRKSIAPGLDASQQAMSHQLRHFWCLSGNGKVSRFAEFRPFCPSRRFFTRVRRTSRISNSVNNVSILRHIYCKVGSRGRFA